MKRVLVSRFRRKILTPAGLLALTFCALALRVFPARETVFPDGGGVRLLGNDAYYSLRQARFSARHFPEVQRWDVGTRYPTGMRSYTTGFFELGTAAVARVLSSDRADEATVDRVIAWMPAVLGALSVLALWWTVRQACRASLAWLAALLYLIYPGLALSRTTLGFSDHHAAEILLLILSVGALLHAVRVTRRRRVARPWMPMPWHALPLTLFLFTWNGAPLHVLLLGAATTCAVAMQFALEQSARETAVAAGRTFGSVLLLVAAIGLLLPQWIIEAAHFPMLLLMLAGVAAAPLLLLALAKRLTRRGIVPWGAALLGLAAGAAAVGGAILFLPHGHDLARILATKSPLIAEHRAVDWDSLLRGYGLLPVFMFWAVPASLYETVRWPRAAPRLLLVWTGTGLLLLLWKTHDYGYAAAPFVSVLAALGQSGARRMLDLAWLRPLPIRAVALAVLVVLPLWPLRWAAPPFLTPERLAPLILADEAWIETTDWLRDQTPAPTLPVDARVAPFGDDFDYPDGTYGVFSAWDYGNLVGALGRRPSVWSQGLSETTARWFTLREEEESIAWLSRRCRGTERIRYVIVDARSLGPGFLSMARKCGHGASEYVQAVGLAAVGSAPLPLFTFGEGFERTVAWRLYARDGEGLHRYRLVFASSGSSLVGYRQQGGRVQRFAVPAGVGAPDTGPETGRAFLTPEGLVHGAAVFPTVKVFEVVPGARLVGTAPASAKIGVRLVVRDRRTGRRHVYRHVYRNDVVCDEAGRFEIVVPYPTSGTSRYTCFVAEGGYRVVFGEERAAGGPPVPVSEDQVLTGARIDLGRVDPD